MDPRFAGIDKVEDSKETAKKIDEDLTQLSLDFYSAIKDSDRQGALALFLKIKEAVEEHAEAS